MTQFLICKIQQIAWACFTWSIPKSVVDPIWATLANRTRLRSDFFFSFLSRLFRWNSILYLIEVSTDYTEIIPKMHFVFFLYSLSVIYSTNSIRWQIYTQLNRKNDQFAVFLWVFFFFLFTLENVYGQCESQLKSSNMIS